MEPREILPGLFHWTSSHPKIGVEVSSHLLADVRVLLDPLLPAGGAERLERHCPPEHVILTNRHHWRHSRELAAAFGAMVWCNGRGLDQVRSEPGADHVRGDDAGHTLVGGIESHDVGALCPDEGALGREQLRRFADA